MKNKLMLVLVLMFANTAYAAELQNGRFYGGFELNSGNLEVNNHEEFVNIGSDETLGFGFRVGYDWSSILMTEWNGNLSSSLNFLGSIDANRMEESQLLMGLKLPLSDRVNIIPWIGWSHWEMYGDEGWLFNSNPERTEAISGSDLVARAEIELSAGDSLKFSLYHSYADYDIAIMSNTSLGMRVYF